MGQVLLVTRPDFCKQKADTCRKMSAGLLEASRIMHQEPQRAVEVLRKRFPQVEASVMDDAFLLIRDSTPHPPHLGTVEFENAERYNIAAGLMKPEQKLAGYSDLFTVEFLK